MASGAHLATVLLVDASPARRGDASFALRRAGWRVLWAASGEEALARWRKLRPALVLLASELPGMSGAATLAQLRAEGYDGDARVVEAPPAA